MANLEQQLLSAVQDENLDEVCRLIEKGANVNNYSFGRTPLCIAAKLGNLSLLELLLNCNASPHEDQTNLNKSYDELSDEDSVRSKRKKGNENQGNNGYYVVVHNESKEGDDLNRNSTGGLVEEILTPEGMDKLEWDIEVEDVFYESDDDIWSNQYRWYADILEKSCYTVQPNEKTKCDINLTDSIGRSPLHYAVEQGHYSAVHLLINAGSRTDIGDVDSVTPLHLAASRGHHQIAELLLRHGANVDSKTIDKMTALHYASSRDFPETVRVLVDHGANLNCLDSTDRTPLKLAASRNLLDVLQILVKHGAKVNIEDNKGYTALCEAVWQKSLAMCQVLLEAGAKVKPTNFLVHYAVMHRHEAMVRLLVEAGALINLRDTMGQTPLITATITDQISLVKYLLDNGAMIDYFWETTPLSAYVASKRGQSLKMVHLLVQRGADAVRSEYHDAPLAMAIVVGKLSMAALLIATGTDVETKFTHPSYNGADALRLCIQLSTSHDLSGILELINTICLAGYNLNKLSFVPLTGGKRETADPVMKLLQERKSNPLQLAELCRVVIRKMSPRGNLISYIGGLALPLLIRDYLLMSNVLLLQAKGFSSLWLSDSLLGKHSSLQPDTRQSKNTLFLHTDIELQ